jgi:hypothetical protein
MDFQVNKNLVYAVADSLGMALTLDHKTGVIAGAHTRTIFFDKLPVTFGMQVASSYLGKNLFMVLSSVVGNLGVLVTAKNEKGKHLVGCHLINVGKLDRLQAWLERNHATTPEEALAQLGPAVVKSFKKTPGNQWLEG